MEIRKPAMAGTLESSDCQVTVGLGEGNIEFALESAIVNRYGNQIRRVVMETLESLDVKDVRIAIMDKDVLGHAIRAKVEDVVFRAAGQCDNLPWGGTVR